MNPMTTHGASSWIELNTKDVADASRFYGEVLGWTVEAMDMGGGMTYHLIKVGDQSIGGFVPNDAAEASVNGWAIYITVDNVDDTLARAKAQGGQVLQDGFDVPTVGRIGRLRDPAGNALFVITYEGN